MSVTTLKHLAIAIALLAGSCHPPALARAGLPHGRERIDGILPARFS